MTFFYDGIYEKLWCELVELPLHRGLMYRDRIYPLGYAVSSRMVGDGWRTYLPDVQYPWTSNYWAPRVR
jgi:hypothetical protein